MFPFSLCLSPNCCLTPITGDPLKVHKSLLRMTPFEAAKNFVVCFLTELFIAAALCGHKRTSHSCPLSSWLWLLSFVPCFPFPKLSPMKILCHDWAVVDLVHMQDTWGLPGSGRKRVAWLWPQDGRQVGDRIITKVEASDQKTNSLACQVRAGSG